MDILYKQANSNVKLSGLSGSLDLDADKVGLNNNPSTFQAQIEADKLKRELQNRPFDPNFMECNLPDPVNTGNVSFNPDDMKFNF